MPILIVIFFLVSSFFYSSKIKEDNPVEFFLIFLIILYSQISGFLTILGIFHILNLKFLFIISIISLITSLKFYKKPALKKEKSEFSIYAIFSISVILSFYTVILKYSLPLPPLTTDGLLYHLPFAVHYIKTHSLSIPYLFFSDIAMSYYPPGGDLLYSFSLLSLPEMFVKFTQLPFVLIGCFSIFLIMKENNFSTTNSIIAASIFALARPVFKESSLCFVDLMMASLFLSTLYFFSSNKKGNIIPGIFSSALLLSVKTLSLLFFFLALPFLLYKKNGSLNKKILYLSIIFFILCGMYAYIRNWILTGNPFFPVEFSIGNFIIFKGMYIYSKVPLAEKIKSLFFLIKNPVSHVDLPFRITVFFSLFYLLSLFFSFKEKKFLHIFLLIPVSIILYLFLLPSHYHQIRHLIPLLGILSISAVYLFKRYEKYSGLTFIIFFILFLPELKSIYLPFLFLLILLFPFIYLSFKKGYSFSLIPAIFIAGYIVFWISVFLPMYQHSKIMVWKQFYREEGDMWEFIWKNSNKGKNISYVGSFLSYPLYGENLKNNVFYQSVNSIKTLPVHMYRGKIKFPKQNPSILYRKNPSFNLWISGLKKKKADWIIIKKDKEYIEKKWIQQHPSLFKKIFSSPESDIYLLLTQ